MAEHLLDNPVWSALTGPHRRLGVEAGRFRRYRADVALFAAGADPAHGFNGLDAAMSAGMTVGLVTAAPVDIPNGIEVIEVAVVPQMVADKLQPATVPLDFGSLGDAHVPAMLELTGLTHPGPFFERTIEMGRYLGVFDGPRLAAMAGERMNVPGYTEVSAVCTHPDYQGRGYAKALVSEIAGGIVSRGLVPFLHVRATNQVAIAAYEKLGFRTRREMTFTVVKKPE